MGGNRCLRTKKLKMKTNEKNHRNHELMSCPLLGKGNINALTRGGDGHEIRHGCGGVVLTHSELDINVVGNLIWTETISKTASFPGHNHF